MRAALAGRTVAVVISVVDEDCSTGVTDIEAVAIRPCRSPEVEGLSKLPATGTDAITVVVAIEVSAVIAAIDD